MKETVNKITLKTSHTKKSSCFDFWKHIMPMAAFLLHGLLFGLEISIFSLGCEQPKPVVGQLMEAVGSVVCEPQYFWGRLHDSGFINNSFLVGETFKTCVCVCVCVCVAVGLDTSH